MAVNPTSLSSTVWFQQPLKVQCVGFRGISIIMFSEFIII